MAKKKKVMLPVNGIESRGGRIAFNISSTWANDDWIRAGRLVDKGLMKAVQEMDNTPMYYEEENL